MILIQLVLPTIFRRWKVPIHRLDKYFVISKVILIILVYPLLQLPVQMFTYFAVNNSIYYVRVNLFSAHKSIFDNNTVQLRVPVSKVRVLFGFCHYCSLSLYYAPDLLVPVPVPATSFPAFEFLAPAFNCPVYLMLFLLFLYHCLVNLFLFFPIF